MMSSHAAFLASAEFKEMNRSFAMGRKYKVNFKVLIKYIATIKPRDYYSPAISKEFVQAVKDLPKTYEEEKLRSFTEKYGTHWVSYVSQGAKFRQIMETDEGNLTKYREDKYRFNQNRANVLSFRKAYGAELDSEDQKLVDKMNAYMRSEKHLKVGPSLPANGSWVTWEEETMKNPGTVYLRVRKLLGGNFDPEFPFLDSQELEPRRKNLEKYYIEYCKRLVSEGKMAVPDCDIFKPREW